MYDDPRYVRDKEVVLSDHRVEVSLGHVEVRRELWTHGSTESRAGVHATHEDTLIIEELRLEFG
ncbi:MAG: hypothetical protein QNJ12_11810 [Ilumatobacter sp.]|uniref:hypothetical protein n=1 Tax=Ilumatobacter sp. TaxID=1967498 RepID=UPI00261A1B59|nr:hypothetical protein [Ilumatobacter sp.]MDJ0769476.1 hypothetical protein [Ilumatobacter sp.]